MTRNDHDPETIERDLELAFAAPVPALTLSDAVSRPLAEHPRTGQNTWRIAGVGALAAALIAAVAFLPGALGGAEPVSARELVDRSARATAALESNPTAYHLRARIEGEGYGSRVTETWFFGAAGTRSEFSDTVNGAIQHYGVIETPDSFWMMATIDGETRAARVAPGVAERPQAGDLAGQSLESVLQGLIIEGCQAATITGSSEVAQRPVHVVEVRPTPDTCEPLPGDPMTEKLSRAAAELGSSTIWIDKETNIQLGVESRDHAGKIVSRYMVELFETGDAVDRSVLAYNPPPGAQVIETNTYSQAKSSIFGRR